jgi:predicted acetyltransferase
MFSAVGRRRGRHQPAAGVQPEAGAAFRPHGADDHGLTPWRRTQPYVGDTPMGLAVRTCRSQHRRMHIDIQLARGEDFAALEQLLELYQYDLSDIWPQDLDDNARYGFDLTRHRLAEGSRAYIARSGVQYVGLALVAPAIVTRTEGTWMEQFFILKRYRRTGAGRALARHVLFSHPGLWEIGQMPRNAVATAFWRRVIGEVTGEQFVERQVTEGWWRGLVQQFEIETGVSSQPVRSR